MSKSVSRHSRFAAGIPAVLHYRGRDYACEAHNLSRSGVLLRGPIPWPSDERVRFSLRSLEGDLTLELEGLRARVEEDPEREGTRLALEFVDLSDETKGTFERLFARVIEKKKPDEGSFDALRPGAPPHEIRKSLECVPLAKRIALAAGAGPREREYLRQDSHPQVLESLAHNANLTITELRQLMGSRHLTAATLESIARDPRWRGDTELPILIATHPRTPVPMAERLIAAMNVAQLRKILNRPTLKPTFRTGIKNRIAKGK